MRLVYMFPGQNSRYPEMIDRLRTWDDCQRILNNASDVLGRDLSEHYRAGNPAMFSHNRDVQIGVFLTTYMLSRRLAQEGLHSDASLGLSLGEYNHLVEIGALSFEDALQILDARGRAYQDGPRGLMISVFPVDGDQVRQALVVASDSGHADVSIELSAKHFVLGGETRAVQAAATWLEEEAFAQSRIVDPALPMHSRMFKPAGDAFGMALQQVEWTSSRQPYIPNVEGRFLTNVKRADFVDRLYRHVFNTVRWAQSVAEVVERFPDASFVEVGPKCVLYNAFRREYRQLRSFCTDNPESETAVLSATVRQLLEIHNAA